MVEKKIYSPWAFRENESEKCNMNKTIYNELKEKYKIAHNDMVYNSEIKKFESINPDNYDVIVTNSGSGYGHQKYKVVKNEPKLSTLELALICDGGNLCFGHRTEGNIIVIHTD